MPYDRFGNWSYHDDNRSVVNDIERFVFWFAVGWFLTGAIQKSYAKAQARYEQRRYNAWVKATSAVPIEQHQDYYDKYNRRYLLGGWPKGSRWVPGPRLVTFFRWFVIPVTIVVVGLFVLIQVGSRSNADNGYNTDVSTTTITAPTTPSCDQGYVPGTAPDGSPDCQPGPPEPLKCREGFTPVTDQYGADACAPN